MIKRSSFARRVLNRSDLRGSSGGSRRGRCSPRLGGLGLGGLGLGGPGLFALATFARAFVLRL